MTQHLPGRQPVAAAQNQHACVLAAHGGVDQRLVVAAFVAATDPQAAVEEEVERTAVGSAGDDDLLDVGLDRHAHLTPVHRAPRSPFEVVDEYGGRGEDAEHGDVGDHQQPAGAAREVPPEQAEDERAAHDGVDRTGDQGRGQLAQQGQEKEREGQAADERSDVVRGEQVGHRSARVLAPDALDQLHQQRDLGADEQADGEGEGDEETAGAVRPHSAPVTGPGEDGVQGQRAGAADQGEDGLDGAEAGRRERAQALRDEGADAHREDHDGQDDGGLGDRVADQVRGEGDEFELVHQSAGGADEDAREDQEPPRARPDREPRGAAPGWRGTGRGGGVRFDHVADGTLRLGHAGSPTRVLLTRGTFASPP